MVTKKTIRPALYISCVRKGTLMQPWSILFVDASSDIRANPAAVRGGPRLLLQ